MAMMTKKKPAAGRSKVAAKPAPAKRTPVAAALPGVGEYCPGKGGVNLGEFLGENGVRYRYFMAVSKAAAAIKGAWGQTERADGATSLRDGMANTLAMIKGGSKLATRTRALRIEGHADYFIAARLEGRLAHLNGSAHFPKDAEAWTSTQHEFHDAGAWVQLFGADGFQLIDLKSDVRRALVLRREIIQ